MLKVNPFRVGTGSSTLMQQDEIDVIRNDPGSLKAKISRQKLLCVILNDKKLWNELQQEMRRQNVHTNECMAQMLNDSLLRNLLDKVKVQENNGVKRCALLDHSKTRITQAVSSSTQKEFEYGEGLASNIKKVMLYCTGNYSSKPTCSNKEKREMSNYREGHMQIRECNLVPSSMLSRNGNVEAARPRRVFNVVSSLDTSTISSRPNRDLLAALEEATHSNNLPLDGKISENEQNGDKRSADYVYVHCTINEKSIKHMTNPMEGRERNSTFHKAMCYAEDSSQNMIENIEKDLLFNYEEKEQTVTKLSEQRSPRPKACVREKRHKINPECQDEQSSSRWSHRHGKMKVPSSELRNKASIIFNAFC